MQAYVVALALRILVPRVEAYQNNHYFLRKFPILDYFQNKEKYLPPLLEAIGKTLSMRNKDFFVEEYYRKLKSSDPTLYLYEGGAEWDFMILAKENVFADPFQLFEPFNPRITFLETALDENWTQTLEMAHTVYFFAQILDRMRQKNGNIVQQTRLTSTSSENNLSTSAKEKTSGDLATDTVTMIVGELNLQKDLMYQTKKTYHTRLTDEYSVGYVGGFADYFLQHFTREGSLLSEDKELSVMMLVFVKVFEEYDGGKYFKNFLDLQDKNSECFFKGQADGFRDCKQWLVIKKGGTIEMWKTLGVWHKHVNES